MLVLWGFFFFLLPLVGLFLLCDDDDDNRGGANFSNISAHAFSSFASPQQRGIVEENVKQNVNGKMYVNINEKLNKMKDIVSKDIKETSTANRTYRDVCANGKGETTKKRVRINTKPFMMQEI